MKNENANGTMIWKQDSSRRVKKSKPEVGKFESVPKAPFLNLPL